MGKYFWTKHVDDEKKHHKQPGCMIGLANVLGYHIFQSSGRKKHQQLKYEDGRDDRRGRSPKRQLFQHHVDDDTESFLDEQESGSIRHKTPETKKRSHKARMRSLLAEEIAKESKNAKEKGGSREPKFQRTYSIHHLQPLDVDWKHPIIYLPRKVDNYTTQSQDAAKTKAAGSKKTRGRSNKDEAEHYSKRNPDVLEMFAVDKGMLVKHLRDGDEDVANFTRSALGLTPNAKLSKSRSFPLFHLSEGRKVKPLKLENKQNEVWLQPRKSKFRSVDLSDYADTLSGELASDTQTSNEFGMPKDIGEEDAVKNNRISRETPKKFVSSEGSGEISDVKSKSKISRDGGKLDNNDVRKYAHLRSSSLTESLDKYARLFENSFKADVKLNPSRSLKVANEYGHPPVHARRMLSLSVADFYFLGSNHEAVPEDPNGNGSTITSKATNSGQPNYEEENAVSLPTSDERIVLNTSTTELSQKEPADEHSGLQINEDGAWLEFPTSDDDSENLFDLKEEEHMPTKTPVLEDSNCSNVSELEFTEEGFILESDASLQEEEPRVELQTSEGLEREITDDLNFSVDSKEMKIAPDKSLLSQSTENLENMEIPDKTTHSYTRDRHPKMDDSNLYYIRCLLDQSGIAVDASEMSWHSADKPFSPDLFEELETCWPHEHDQLTGLPEFYGCWHHRMLFDLVNEVVLELFDTALPYYPKALSSSCQVPPFPSGDLIIDEVIASIRTLLNLKNEEMQTVDSFVALDIARDRSWMNLQTESECVAIELEDMIFDQVLEEIMHS